ncbi:WD40-repeat-containing domain protein [Microdochium trichocladiopsis]|uniref:WD40-repeat-containing domain protein n=1 Tax=Microdochium trichocladiopsis TaxID=1682393 RepID=A0A9P8YIV4_9PEZI|nr:WD40-repeat-containing domain protein [Microdochium trichocladiopsis]KAH7039834.1 WD40-repeat-containing domain protein [Microdochium trichocladiopsis]
MAGGQDLAGAGGQHAGGAGHASNQPQATEYTLQGVMRFLQTEWHKHERDRNAWEIERQEMKGRIAALEGSARRADATQKALKRYVNILEKKVKEQATHLKTASVHSADSDDHSVKQPPRFDRASMVQEQLKRSEEHPKEPIPGLEGVIGDRTQEEDEREHLRSFLDQCQAEFTYLMITPANPIPPRESPPLPVIEDLRDGDQFGMPNNQQALEAAFQGMRISQGNHPKDAAAASRSALSNPNMNPNVSLPTGLPAQNPSQSAARGNSELQSAMMMRSGDGMQPAAYAQQPGEWQTAAGNARLQNANDEAARAAASQLGNDLGNQGDRGMEVLLQQPPRKQDRRANNDADGWDFNEAAFPDATPSQQAAESQSISHRPDTDVFPAAEGIPKSPTRGPASHRRKGSMSRRRSADQDALNAMVQKADAGSFKLRYGLRGHLNTVRTVIFSGGGSPGEPEICTAGDDGLVKRFHLPRESSSHLGASSSSDLDVTADFTHRGHNGAVLCLTSWTPSPNFATGGRAQGDGWIFSGGQDATIRVWERGRVDPKATLEGHTDAVWAITVLPATLGAVFGPTEQANGQGDRILIVSGSADGSVKIWAVSAPPQLSSPQPSSAGGRRGTAGGRVRGNSMSSGSQFPNSPQPSMASNSQFNYTLVHDLRRADGSTASPTSITPLASNGEKFVVSYSDAAIIVFDTKSGDEVGSMASRETYDGTLATSVNAVQATITSLDSNSTAGMGEEDAGGPTGGTGKSGSGVEGVIISGHEDRFISLFDANSGQCTYTMLAHPDAISSLSLSPDGRELVSAGHDASLRFWSLEKRNCVQEMTVHRIMRGEGVCSVVWSQDGRWVVSGGGDGLVKVFAR